jgi:hypothetical protein
MRHDLAAQAKPTRFRMHIDALHFRIIIMKPEPAATQDNAIHRHRIEPHFRLRHGFKNKLVIALGRVEHVLVGVEFINQLPHRAFPRIDFLNDNLHHH